MSGTGRNGRCTTELDEVMGAHKAELRWTIKARHASLKEFPKGRVLRSDPFFDPAYPKVTGVVELVPGGTAESTKGYFDALVVVKGLGQSLKCTRVQLEIGHVKKTATKGHMPYRTFAFPDFATWDRILRFASLLDEDLLITASFVFRKRFEEETIHKLREDKDSKDKVKNTKGKDQNTKGKDQNTKDKDKNAKVTVREGSKTRRRDSRRRYDSGDRKSSSRDRKASRDKSRRASVRKASERREDKGKARRGSPRDKSMGRRDKSVYRRDKSSTKSSEKTKRSPRRRWDSEDSEDSEEGWAAVKASLDRLVHDSHDSDSDDSDFDHRRAKGHRKHQ